MTADDAENYPRMIELWFLFSMIWSICASVDEASRKKMDNYVRELEGQFPSKVGKKKSPLLLFIYYSPVGYRLRILRGCEAEGLGAVGTETPRRLALQSIAAFLQDHRSDGGHGPIRLPRLQSHPRSASRPTRRSRRHGKDVRRPNGSRPSQPASLQHARRQHVGADVVEQRSGDHRK